MIPFVCINIEISPPTFSRYACCVCIGTADTVIVMFVFRLRAVQSVQKPSMITLCGQFSITLSFHEAVVATPGHQNLRAANRSVLEHCDRRFLTGSEATMTCV